jgi:type IV secretory pathway TrbD component
MIADANGESAEVYASGHIARLRWLGDGETFAFDRDDAVWLGERGKPLRRLEVPTNQVLFAGADRIVYLESDGLLAGDLAGGMAWITGAGAISWIDAVVAS